MKKVAWITVLNKEANETPAKLLYQAVSKYGLAPAGHFWQDDLAQMAWSAPIEDLLKQDTGVWVILGSAEDLAVEAVRYGLSLLALVVQARKGNGFPILIAATKGDIDPAGLPTPLGGADILAADAAALGPKITAKANMPVKHIETEYRVDVYGIQGLGQWFEVGPAAGHAWDGVMFGVSGGDISAHGVGPAHKLPERSILEYPMKGLKLQMGEREYTAWAVKNHMDEDASYYLKVNEYPSSLLFGPMSEGDDAEVFIISLK